MEPICYRELEIAAPAAKVWDVIKDPMNLDYMPLVRKVEVTDGGTRRLVTIDYSGIEGYEVDEFVAPELCYNVDHAGFRYNYKFDGDYLPITDHESTVEILPLTDTTCKFVWRCVWTLTEPMSAEDEKAMAVSVEDIWWGGMNRVKEMVEPA